MELGPRLLVASAPQNAPSAGEFIHLRARRHDAFLDRFRTRRGLRGGFTRQTLPTAMVQSPPDEGQVTIGLRPVRRAAWRELDHL
jgi:hypothetical protein